MRKIKALFQECPECGSTKIEVGVTMQRVTVYNNGEKMNSSVRSTDAGYTKCYECKFVEYN